MRIDHTHKTPEEFQLWLKYRRKPYHPLNLDLQPFAHWKVRLLAYVGSFLGVQFHINGIPFGAKYDPSLWPEAESCEAGK